MSETGVYFKSRNSVNVHFNDDCAYPGDDAQHTAGEGNGNDNPINDLAFAETIDTAGSQG